MLVKSHAARAGSPRQNLSQFDFVVSRADGTVVFATDGLRSALFVVSAVQGETGVWDIVVVLVRW